MCGIAGAFGGLSGVDRGAIAKQIIQKIRYRGPDGDGVEHFDDGLFVHLRLSIIDTTGGGSQPKWSANKRFCITYNGEIYNYRELKAELAASGHVFTTESDTEVLLKVWEAWGYEGLKRCIGMYAFALFDAERRELHFARDVYGIKPLYVAEFGGGVRFGSTYPALTCFPECPRQVNPAQSFDYVRYGTVENGEATLVAGVRSLEPGMVETWDVSGTRPRIVRSQSIGRPIYNAAGNTRTFDQAAEELREAFFLAVRLHMRSDVPIGFALSGGIDSSAIVCAARILEPDADLRTFTYAAEGGAVDESPWAKLVSDHTKASPHIIRMRSTSAVGSAHETVQKNGTPTGGMSTQAQYAVFEAAHEAGMKVMLDGQGGDETFAGYTFYIGAALAGRLRHGEIGGAIQMFRNAIRVPRVTPLIVAGSMGEHMLPPSIKWLLRRVVGLTHVPDWLDTGWLTSRTGASIDALVPVMHKFGSDVLGERLAYDLKERQLPSLLLYEDRNSMTHSLESRVPFLSSPVTDIAYSVPSSYHLGPDGVGKRLLRAAMRGIVPDAIMNRQDKVGFDVPRGDWLSKEHEQVDRILRSDAARSIKLFDHKRMLAHWDAIDRPSHPDFKYVWRWMSLVLWTQTFDIQWA